MGQLRTANNRRKRALRIAQDMKLRPAAAVVAAPPVETTP